MSQVTLYVDETTQSKMRVRAKKAGLSISKWLVSLIQKEINENWPAEVQALPGTWGDFPSLNEIRSGLKNDLTREKF